MRASAANDGVLRHEASVINSPFINEIVGRYRSQLRVPTHATTDQSLSRRSRQDNPHHTPGIDAPEVLGLYVPDSHGSVQAAWVAHRNRPTDLWVLVDRLPWGNNMHAVLCAALSELDDSKVARRITTEDLHCVVYNVVGHAGVQCIRVSAEYNSLRNTSPPQLSGAERAGFVERFALTPGNRSHGLCVGEYRDFQSASWATKTLSAGNAGRYYPTVARKRVSTPRRVTVTRLTDARNPETSTVQVQHVDIPNLQVDLQALVSDKAWQEAPNLVPVLHVETNPSGGSGFFLREGGSRRRDPVLRNDRIWPV